MEIGYRIIQVIIHLLLGSFLAVSVLVTEWIGVPVIDALLGTPVPFVICVLSFGSALLNFKLILNAPIRITIKKGFYWPAIALAVAGVIIYFTEGQRSSYDTHLSFYSVTVKYPEWVWLPEGVDRFDISIASTAEGILTALFTVLLCYLLLFLKIMKLTSQPTAFSRSDKVLVICQITFGLFLFSIGAMLVYRSIGDISSFYTTVQEYSDLLNTHNVSGLVSRSLACILFILYGQWILRDGVKLWKLR